MAYRVLIVPTKTAAARSIVKQRRPNRQRPPAQQPSTQAPMAPHLLAVVSLSRLTRQPSLVSISTTPTSNISSCASSDALENLESASATGTNLAAETSQIAV